MNNKHINLLFDYSELNNLFKKSFNIDTFFQKIVDLIARHMQGNICSIFLYDDIKDELFSKASTDKNFNKSKIISFKLDNNYIGLSLENFQPVINNMEDNHIDSKLLKNFGNYKSFIAIPIFRGKIKFGVIVIQSKTVNIFDKEDVLALQIISSQLAFLIESAKIFLTLPDKKRGKRKTQEKKIQIDKNKHIRGESASNGVVYSEGIVYENVYNIENIGDLTKNIHFTLEDFNAALINTELQLEKIQKEVENKLSDTSSLIFTAHLLILKDKFFLNEIYKRIKKGENIPKALLKIFYKYKNIFLRMSDPLIKEKIQDIEDLIIRLLTNLIKLKLKNTGID